MKILQINTVSYGSTGKIALELKSLAEKNNIEMKIASRYKEKNKVETDYYVSSWLDCHIHNRIARYTGLGGCFSFFKTMLFLKKVKIYNPDIIHLHNIHSNYINLYLLFRFIKKYNIKTVWTLHDCWACTGNCPHFTIVKCDRWKTVCNNCPQSENIIAKKSVKKMHLCKKKWISNIQKLVLVANSEWTANQARASYLNKHIVKVIYNGIDLQVFKPTDSEFRRTYGIGSKYIVLGVAFGWGRRKGLDVFVELAQRLDSAKYQIVLVGTDDGIDKQLLENIISIHRTQNQTELAEIYTAADVFVNPTREEAFGLVNVEALACGTPGITFDTGGSPECFDETCGVVVDCDDIDEMESEIIRICEEKPYSQDACLAKARGFDKDEKFKEYINLYSEL